MSSKKTAAAANAIDLNDPAQAGTLLFVRFGGVRMTVDARRLTELLEREQQLLALLAGGTPAAAKAGDSRKGGGSRTKPAPVVTGGAGDVTHASLSTRIKKIFMFTYESRSLRPAHQQILTDVLDGFDWHIPEHPNTRLDQQLAEIATWPGVPDALKKKIGEFLPRYLEARGLSFGRASGERS
jgi:hypothetical protein